MSGPDVKLQFSQNAGFLPREVHDHAVLGRTDDVVTAVNEEDWRRVRGNFEAPRKFVLVIRLEITGICGNREVRTATDFAQIVDRLVGRLFESKREAKPLLTSESISGGSPTGTLTYDYDAVGNRTNRTGTLGSLGSQTFNFDLGDRIGNNSDPSDASCYFDDNGTTLAATAKPLRAAGGRHPIAYHPSGGSGGAFCWVVAAVQGQGRPGDRMPHDCNDHTERVHARDHNRVPVIPGPEAQERWMDTTNTTGEGLDELLGPYDGKLKAEPAE